MTTILVCEDTELLRRMYHDRLAADGYDVVDAPDGMEAVAALRSGRVDLVVLDLIMPRMGGIEVLEAISADPRTKGTPVVVLTNLGEEDTIERAVALGALDYLLKNETRPNDVSEKVRLTLSAFHAPDEAATSAFRIRVRDREDDADALISHAELKRRFWCPACENELALELVPVPEHHGHYDARFICPACGRDFAI